MWATPCQSRRGFLRSSACFAAGCASAAPELPPVRAITRGPKHHWFGYYDKLQFDPSGRYVLGMEVEFEHRSPRPDDKIRVGMVDLRDGDRWIDLGESHAWNWQQGCMLQWLPGSKTEVIWNDREQGQFVAHILDVRTGKKRTLPAPIYALSPDGRWAAFPDFRRLHECRPGYGYAGIPDPNRDQSAPQDAGIWRMDLRNGRTELLFTIAEAAGIPFPHGDWSGAKHWFNHLLFAPGGKRLCFLQRWKSSRPRRFTRMFTMDCDGKRPFLLMPYGHCSHFVWRDPRHVLAWSLHPSHKNGLYLWEDQTANVAIVGKDILALDCHHSCLPGNRYILGDSYPDQDRNQRLFLFNVETGKLTPLGDFRSPKEYTGEWRCDTHPRYSPDGRLVTIDSPHSQGRQIYLIDISSIVGRTTPRV